MKKAVIIAACLVGLTSLSSYAQQNPRNRNSRQNMDSTTNMSTDGMNNRRGNRQSSSMQSDSGMSNSQMNRGKNRRNQANQTNRDNNSMMKRDTTRPR